MSRAFSPRTFRTGLWLAAASAAIGVFLKITDEVVESEKLARADAAIVEAVASLRTPWLNATAVDLTALGSLTLVVLLTLGGAGTAWLARDRVAAAQIAIASAGAGLRMILTKNLVQRERPAGPHLVEVSGFAYPCGHALAATALYVTLAPGGVPSRDRAQAPGRGARCRRDARDADRHVPRLPRRPLPERRRERRCIRDRLVTRARSRGRAAAAGSRVISLPGLALPCASMGAACLTLVR